LYGLVDQRIRIAAPIADMNDCHRRSDFVDRGIMAKRSPESDRTIPYIRPSVPDRRSSAQLKYFVKPFNETQCCGGITLVYRVCDIINI